MTRKRGKDRKERNLASSREPESPERVTTMDLAASRRSVVSVCVSGEGSPHRLVAWPFIRCLGRLSPRQWHVPHIPPDSCMWFFLSPGSGRSGRVSVSRHIFHNDIPMYPSFEARFGWVFIPCLVCIWLACQEVLQQTSQTNFEAIV